MTQRHQIRFPALGSEAQFTIVADVSQDEAAGLFGPLQEKTAAFEQRFSRFKPDSELTGFNARAGERVPVSQAFLSLLSAAHSMAERTNGLYNPFVLPSLQRAGYAGSWPKPDTVLAETNFSSRELVSADSLEIGDGWACIPHSAALDFGGIGKGYLLDELADWLDGQGPAGYWLSLGGDIVAAGRDLGGQAWQIGIQHATEPSKSVGDIVFDGSRQAVATSGVTKRRGMSAGAAWHHIIDPRTALPANTDVLTATVVAPNATAADVYAKCVVIDGPPLAEIYQQQNVITAYYIQMAGEDGVVTSAHEESGAR